MKRNIVKGSKLVFSEGYSEKDQILEIRFKAHDGQPGHIYQYKAVSPQKYEEFRAASSAGRFILNKVKPFHDCERMDKDEAKPEAPEAESETPAPEPPAAS